MHGLPADQATRNAQVGVKGKVMSKSSGSTNIPRSGSQNSGQSKGASNGGGSRPGAGAGKGPGNAGGWPSTTGSISGGNRSNGQPR